MVVPQAFLSQHPDVVENYLKAEIEALAFSVAPKNKPTVIKTIMKKLKANANDAEEGYQDLLKGVDRKPFPSLDGLRNVQRMLKTRNPKIGEIKTEDVIDARIMRKLDESGFIDRAYAAQGVSANKLWGDLELLERVSRCNTLSRGWEESRPRALSGGDAGLDRGHG